MKYLSHRKDETTADEDEPVEFCVHNKNLYPYYVPDASYTGYLDYYAWEDDPDNIQLPDEWEECIVEGTCFKYLEAKGLGQKATALTHKALFEDWKLTLSGVVQNREGMKFNQYNDI